MQARRQILERQDGKLLTSPKEDRSIVGQLPLAEDRSSREIMLREMVAPRNEREQQREVIRDAIYIDKLVKDMLPF